MNTADPALTGELIRRLRTEKGLTQQVLADMLFVSAKAVSKWECGKGMPDLTQINNLSEIFSVPAEVILKGEFTENDIQGGYMKNLKFYICPVCGNIFTSSGEGQVSCCGKKLSALVPEKAEENQKLNVEKMDEEYFISSSHEMTKDNYISFCALITGDAFLMRKTYPEWDFQIRMPMLSRGKLVWYSASEGLLYQYI